MFSTLGALVGLLVAIVLIIRKVTPAYALVLGALLGGLVGGGGLVGTVDAMIGGTKTMMPSVLRILASGVLVGALVKTGSAAKIADAIVEGLGTRFALAAVALATAIVCAVGVFVDIAVITVAPVALAVGRRANLSVPAILLAMVGGGKAGNIVSPNPNTIAAADAFKVDLTSLMGANVVPAICALVATVLLAAWLARRTRFDAAGTPRLQDGEAQTDAAGAARLQGDEAKTDAAGAPRLQDGAAPSIIAALAGPLAVVVLLALRPLFKISVDPLVALPVGGLVSAVVCGRWRESVSFAEFGLGKVTGVAILLIGTGTIAGIVKGSCLNADMIALLGAMHLPTFVLAPVSGILMAGATASTTAGATIASQTFSGALLEAGVPALASAAMIHAGATVIDSLPHGSFFHATGGAVGMSVSARLRLIPYEAAVGLVSTIVSVAMVLTCSARCVPADISADAARQTVIAEGGTSAEDGYQGHPTTVLTREGKLLCVWTLGHGGPCGPAAESTDLGRTWTRIDGRFPKVYRETHLNCPTLQKCVRPDGGERLFVFSAKIKGDPNAPTNFCRLATMISDDGGKSWREGKVADLSARMPPTGFMTLKDGSLALFGQVRLDVAVKTDRPQDDQGVWMSVSRDAGETWSPMRVVAEAPGRNLCEPCCLRSPDGSTLALLMRENRHLDRSMMCFSTDEGKTWTKPVLTAPELTGDRHEALALGDGRYLICFRDQMKQSPTLGQYVGWVGTWDDLRNARPGERRIRLLNHHGKKGVWPGNEFDTGYSGVERLPDGTILCTTYTKHWDDGRWSSVVATRLYPSDLAR